MGVLISEINTVEGLRLNASFGVVLNRQPFEDNMSWLIFDNGELTAQVDSLYQAREIVKGLLFIQ